LKVHSGTLGLTIIVAIWQLVDLLQLFNPIYFASPLEVLAESFDILSTSTIYSDISHTVLRVLTALVISLLVGVPVGLLLGYYSKIHALFGGFLDFMRSIPPVVFFPLFYIALGPNDSSRIMTAALGASVLGILVVSKYTMQLDKTRLHYFRSLNFSQFMLFKNIIWYESLPAVIVAAKAISSWVVVIIIVTEMLVGPKHGLGARVQSVQITNNIPDLFFTIILIGAVGLIINILITMTEKRLIFWLQSD